MPQQNSNHTAACMSDYTCTLAKIQLEWMSSFMPTETLLHHSNNILSPLCFLVHTKMRLF